MFYLDAPIEKVVKRNQSRSGKRGEYMNTALLRKLYEKVSRTKGNVSNEIIIDTTNLSAKQTARSIVSCTEAMLNGVDIVSIMLPDADIARSLEHEM
jgi:thymidylate kinase